MQKLNFKNFNKTELAAKLLCILRTFNTTPELLENRELFDKWCNDRCAENFIMAGDNEINGCRIYLQAFLLNIENNKFSLILNS